MCDILATLPKVTDGAGRAGLVSVIIPTYNRAYIIREAIASALAQVGVDVEVIVADDGSDDATTEAVSAAAIEAGRGEWGPRVVYVRQENAGVAAARNLGMRHARGEFIAFLDSDDRWLPWKLGAQVALLRRFSHVVMTWTDMSAVDAEGTLECERYLREFYGAYTQVRLEDVCETVADANTLQAGVPACWGAAPVLVGDIFASMLLGNLVHTSTVLLRRSVLATTGGFDESLRPSGEDYEFHLRTTSVGPVALLDVPSTLYRVGHPDQLTAPDYLIAIARNDLRTMLRWRRVAESRHAVPRRVLRRRLAHSYAWVGEEHFRHGERRAAAGALLHSVVLRPRLRQAAFLLLSLLPPGMTELAYRALELIRELDVAATLPLV